jgi:hypothetical protein
MNFDKQPVITPLIINGLVLWDYTDAVDKPLKFIQSREKAFKLIERWNRRFATH